MTNDYQQAEQQLSTIGDFLRWGVTQFERAGLTYGHGIDNPWDEALSLVWHALHLPYEINPQVLQAALTQSEKLRIIALYKERIEQRIPTAYLTNKAIFAGIEFFVDQRVLIPRSPLAELIESEFSAWFAEGEVTRILDLCTGSACIAVACAHYCPQATVDAVDISEDALAVAQVNVEQYGLQDQVNLLQGDLFQPLDNKQYDVIISNPPYVGREELEHLPLEYHHEPRLGFAAGEQGLDIVDQILSHAKQHLTEDGILIVEVGNSADALIEAYPDVPFQWLEFERGGDGVFMLEAGDLHGRQ